MFLTTSILTAALNFFTSIETVLNLPISKSSTFVFKLFNPAGALTNLLMSSLLTPAFKEIKSLLAAKLDVSTPAAFVNSF